MKLSVCIITLNEEANIGRTLKSVQPLVADGQGEIIVVDSGSTDKTVEIAKSYEVLAQRAAKLATTGQDMTVH